jgi:hypothetical protein
VIVPLLEIEQIERGQSCLPVRAGIPLIGRLIPGRPAKGETLIIRTCSASGQRLLVLAGLPESTPWVTSLQTAIAAIPQFKEIRGDRAHLVQTVAQNKADVDAQLTDVAARLIRVVDEIGKGERARQDVQRELALPDWETITLHLKGRDLQKQLERQLATHTRAGWELVSSTSPRPDELLVSMKRVRQV